MTNNKVFMVAGKTLQEMGLVKDHADPHFDLCGEHRQDFIRFAASNTIEQIYNYVC
jgi:hypothetical protein